MNKALLSFGLIVTLFGCSKNSDIPIPHKIQRELSPTETAYLNTRAPNEPVAVLIYSQGQIERKTVLASEVLSEQETVLDQHADAVFALDFPVSAENIQDDFSGKTEFNLVDWKNEAPLADGRGVSIAVVDDGVGLKRAGLVTTSTGAQKISRFINTNPRWNLRTTPAALPLTLELSACGIVRATDRPIKTCHDLGETFKDGKRVTAILRQEEGRYRLALATGTVLSPLSENLESRIDLTDATAWGFDVFEDAPGSLLVSIKIPERGYSSATRVTTGSHGEGVAGIAAGHRLGNRDLDGVAPGAQVVDVHFTDGTDATPYTIGNVLEALILGGKSAKIVNLSYSLFFDHPAAQVSMGRLMEAALGNLDALFFFSAGNNGPGIGSMNRALLYPSFGIPVAAYLSGRLAQTTFGSAEPMPAVAPYSSVGPGIDGGSGALLLSPLAGMTTSTSDGGYQPFSGTSSATPALAGFAARLASRIQLDGLAWDRTIFREALIRSAVPLPNVPFISQGYGIPSLPRAYAAYRALLGEKLHPSMTVNGSQNVGGVIQKGIYVRSPRELLPQYVFNIGFKFPAGVTLEGRSDQLELVEITKSGDFFYAPDRLLLGHMGGSLQVTFDSSRLRASGAYTGELRIKLVSTGQIVTVPITVLVPEKDFGQLEQIRVAKGGETRIFFESKRPHANLLIQVQSMGGFCGRIGVYSPSSIRLSSGVQTNTLSPRLQEIRYPLAQTGVYELVIEGRQNHRVCPADQVLQVRTAIVSAAFTVINQNADTLLWAIDSEIESNEVARSATEIFLEDPVQVSTLKLISVPGDSATLRTATPFTVPAGKTARIFSEERTTTAKVARYPYWNVKQVTATDAVDLDLVAVDGGYGSDLEEPQGPVDLEWTRFEKGLAEADLPSNLGRVELWLQDPTEKSQKIQLGWKDPTTSGVQRTAAPRTLEPRQWSCRIRPAGFILASASCGRVER